MTTALNIIHKIGARVLSDYDGSCPCGSFEIAGIKVWFHCWKSGSCRDCKFSGVHVEKVHQDVKEDLTPIGECVVRELKESWPHTDWEIQIKL